MRHWRGRHVCQFLRAPVALFGLAVAASFIHVTPAFAQQPAVEIVGIRTSGTLGQHDDLVLLRIVDPTAELSNWKLRVSDSVGVVRELALPTIPALSIGCTFAIANRDGETSRALHVFDGDIEDQGGVALVSPLGAVVERVGLGPGSAFVEGRPLDASGAAHAFVRQARIGDNRTDFTPGNMATDSGPYCLAFTWPELLAYTSPGWDVVAPGSVTRFTAALFAWPQGAVGIDHMSIDLSAVGGPTSVMLPQGGGHWAFDWNVPDSLLPGYHPVVFTATEMDGRLVRRILSVGILDSGSTINVPEYQPIARVFDQTARAGGIVTVTVEFPLDISTDATVFVDTRSLGGVRAFLPVQSYCPPYTACASGPVHAPFGAPPGVHDVPVVVGVGGREFSYPLRLTVTPFDDLDADGLADAWESAAGLSTESGIGDDGPAGDPDGDGLVNLDEMKRESHPRGLYRYHFAEMINSDSGLLSTSLSLANMGPTPATILGTREDGGSSYRSTFTPVTLGNVRELWPRTWGNSFASVTTGGLLVESDQPLAVTRGTSWFEGTHAEVAQPVSRTWYFAEGTAQPGFDTFFAIANFGDAPATIDARYLRGAGGEVLDRAYVVQAHSRATIWINVEEAALAGSSFAAQFSSNQPLVVERSMYLTTGTQVIAGTVGGWVAGTSSAGQPAPASTWYFAEGATGDMFNAYLLLANFSDADADVAVEYVLEHGAPVTRRHLVPARSRVSIAIADEGPELRSASFGMQVDVVVGPAVVAERSMWWPGPAVRDWLEGHTSAGQARAASSWAVVGPTDGTYDKYVLLANFEARDVTVDVRRRRSSSTEDEHRSIVLAARSRTTVRLADLFEETTYLDLTVITAASPVDGTFVVECSTYGETYIGPSYAPVRRPWGDGSSIPGVIIVP